MLLSVQEGVSEHSIFACTGMQRALELEEIRIYSSRTISQEKNKFGICRSMSLLLRLQDEVEIDKDTYSEELRRVGDIITLGVL